MREIKFRAWDKMKKKMVKVNSVYFPNRNNKNMYVNNIQCNTPESFELMEYTGLKDADGKEIYEGDYIRFTDFDSNQGYEGEVAFKGGAFCMLYKIEGAMRNVIMATMLDVDGYIEIVGNIYENPELLEVTE